MKKMPLNRLSASLGFALASLLAAAPVHAQPGAPALMPAEFNVGPALDLVVGKSTLMRVPSAVTRISIGNPNVVDVTLISPTELYLLGKTYGSTNLIVWRKSGGATAIDINVNIDFDRMEKKLRELLPGETGIRVRPAADSVILTGTVTSALKARQAEDIANAFVRDVNKSLVLPIAAGDAKVAPGTKMQVSAQPGGGAGAGAATGAKVVNLLKIAEAQQVMLEVTIAEVSKTLLDKLGVGLSGFRLFDGNWTYSLLSAAASTLGTLAGQVIKDPVDPGFRRIEKDYRAALEAQKKDGLIKILAEPNIVAISGQEASFLAGGKVFIPVARENNATGGTTITLEEKEFGVGLKFTPTVLEGGRIHLKVAPEVSELSQTGSPFTTLGGATSVLPSFTTRRVQTSVQLMDGQSLAIAGLIKNNVTQAMDKIPGLGEVPVMGALFRSNEFQSDRSELMFVITPRLVKPLDPNYILPTDGFAPPSRSQFYLGNKLEGSGHEEVPADRRNTPAPAAPGGMEVK